MLLKPPYYLIFIIVTICDVVCTSYIFPIKYVPLLMNGSERRKEIAYIGNFGKILSDKEGWNLFTCM